MNIVAERTQTKGLKYQGKDYDSLTGLVYMNARWYDPEIGRFISEDPARDGGNWYAFVSNNPLRFTDPSGLFGTAVLEFFAPVVQGALVEAGITVAGVATGAAKLKSATDNISKATDVMGPSLNAVVAGLVLTLAESENNANTAESVGEATSTIEPTEAELPLITDDMVAMAQAIWGTDSVPAQKIEHMQNKQEEAAEDAEETKEKESEQTGETEIPQKAKDTLEHIDETGEAQEGYEGGRTFENREGNLPNTDADGNEIEYKEWDINPKQPGVNRGGERLVTGSDGSAYYTGDHYGTFTPIR